jgi:hypothetical protein
LSEAKPLRPFTPNLEALEDRTTPSVTMHLSGTNLRLTGDAQNNTVTVRQSGSKIKVIAATDPNVNGFFLTSPTVTQTKTFNAASVKKITFYGNDGNDSFADLTRVRAAAFGGQGNDDLTAGTSGKDFLSGGYGYDTAHLAAGMATTDTEVVDVGNLPGGSPQSTNTCGPNSGWRVLKSYGSRATLQSVIDRASEGSIVSRWNLGTTGATLVDAMNFSRVGMKHAHSFSLKTRSSLDSLLGDVAAGRPVVAMISVAGSETVDLGSSVGGFAGSLVRGIPGTSYTVPALHWIAVDGFDRQQGLIFYHDTDGNRYQTSFGAFQSRWNWNFGTVTNTIFQGLGVVPGTYIV